MAARYLSPDEVLRRVLNDDSDGDYSDESEAELSEEDDNNGRSEHEERKEDESDELLPDEANSEESGKFLYQITSIRFHFCCLRVFTSIC